MKKRILNRSDVQFAFFIIAVLVTVNHSLTEIGKGIAWISSGYIHYVCPICGVTTIYQLFASSLGWIDKLANPVTWVILITMVMAIFFGPLFCGWICPFGAFQDFVANNIGKKIFKKKYNKFINKKVDSKLRWIRYISLAFVFYMTAKSAVTVLESVNPYHALLNLFIGEFSIIGLGFLLVIIIASLFIHRPWCKYLCPYGALLGVFNIFRVKTIVRDEATCISCKKCDRACPMNIEVSKNQVIRDHQCISCLECTSNNACPIDDTVSMKKSKGIVEKIQLNVKNVVAFIVAVIALGTLTASITSNKSSVSRSAIDVSNLTNQLNGTYESGTYIGEGVGFNTGLMVETTIDNNQIVNIKITDHNETVGYYETAFEAMPNSIILEQSTTVDTVSGATRSSEGIIEAVNDALEQALISSDSMNTDTSTKQSATTDNNSNTEENAQLSGNNQGENQQNRNEQSENEELENVQESIVFDTPGDYIDGVYTGKGIGYGGDLTVEVTVENGNITKVEVLDNNETTVFLDKTSSMVTEIISNQSTDIDTVSGATMSSNGIIDAVNNALKDAQ